MFAAPMNKLCTWCKKIIDGRQHVYVSSRDGRMRFHVRCYGAWTAWAELHSFQPLDPATHDHGR